MKSTFKLELFNPVELVEKSEQYKKTCMRIQEAYKEKPGVHKTRSTYYRKSCVKTLEEEIGDLHSIIDMYEKLIMDYIENVENSNFTHNEREAIYSTLRDEISGLNGSTENFIFLTGFILSVRAKQGVL